MSQMWQVPRFAASLASALSQYALCIQIVFAPALAGAATTAAGSPPAPPATSTALAEPSFKGSGPEKFSQWLEWVGDLHLSAEQRKTLRSLVDADWSADDAKQVSNIDAMSSLSAAGRTAAREVQRKELLDGVREKPRDLTREDEVLLHWWVDAYYAEHPRLAEGSPPDRLPLTAHELDATVELMSTFWKERVGKSGDTPSPLQKRQIAANLVQRYGSMPVALQKVVYTSPIINASMHLPGFSDREKMAKLTEPLFTVLAPAVASASVSQATSRPDIAESPQASTLGSQAGADRFAGVAARPVGPVRMHGAVGYIAPVGWTVKDTGDGMTLLTGPDDRTEPCVIVMFPPLPALNDLAAQGVDLVAQTKAKLFANLGPFQDDRGRDVRETREEGVSTRGWEYVDLLGQFGGDGILNGNVKVRVLVARIGDQVLQIMGLTKTARCLGNLAWRDNATWALLFHSLQLPGYTGESRQLAQQLVGTWTISGSRAGVTQTYASNGRFGSVAVYQSYELSSRADTVLEVNRSWQGDGPYTVHGDRLHTENAHAGESERNVTRLFSIVRMPKEDQPGQFNEVLRVVEHADNDVQGANPDHNYVTSWTKQQ
jgi:hypothetical protein